MSERLNSFSFHHCWNQKLAIPYGWVGFSFVEECFSPSLALILGPFSTFVIILPKDLKGRLTPSLTLKMRDTTESCYPTVINIPTERRQCVIKFCLLTLLSSLTISSPSIPQPPAPTLFRVSPSFASNDDWGCSSFSSARSVSNC